MTSESGGNKSPLAEDSSKTEQNQTASPDKTIKQTLRADYDLWRETGLMSETNTPVWKRLFILYRIYLNVFLQQKTYLWDAEVVIRLEGQGKKLYLGCIFVYFSYNSKTCLSFCLPCKIKMSTKFLFSLS